MKNSHGSFNLNLSGFELYGKAHGEWLFGFKWIQFKLIIKTILEKIN